MKLNRSFFLSSCRRVFVTVIVAGALSFVLGQSTAPRKTSVELGSRTAKQGFRNEDEIKAKFENWSADSDAKAWLATMGYKTSEVQSVTAIKPHGEKSDIEVTVKTRSDARTEGISIKLVSSPNGFNQIDKRWLSQYAAMWKMPPDVQQALKLFVGETPPTRKGRSAERMFLNEIDESARKVVISFFETHKADIVSDLFQGDGRYSADWVMVALKATENTRWTLQRVDDVIRFYSDGPVVLTSGGNLRIGRITMQRKGGDGGRDTAKMLQFKINPALLLSR